MTGESTAYISGNSMKAKHEGQTINISKENISNLQKLLNRDYNCILLLVNSSESIRIMMCITEKRVFYKMPNSFHSLFELYIALFDTFKVRYWLSGLADFKTSKARVCSLSIVCSVCQGRCSRLKRRPPHTQVLILIRIML